MNTLTSYLGEIILQQYGLTPCTYANVCLNECLGVCSEEGGANGHLYRAIAVMSADNEGELSISYEDAKDIALSADILYTDMGVDVHSSSFKNKPFKGLQIIKVGASAQF